MSEDTAAHADAGTEMVFRTSRARRAFKAAVFLALWAAFLYVVVQRRPEAALIIVFVCYSLTATFMVLNSWRSGVGVSEDGLKLIYPLRKHLIPARDLGAARMTRHGDLKIAFEYQGRILCLRISRMGIGRSERQRLFNAIRELWPGIITE